MRRRNLASLRRLAFSSFLVSCILACGSRTGLFGEEDGINSNPNPFADGGNFPPGTLDGGIDLRDGGVIVPDDAPSTIDARPVPPDVFRADCPDSDTLLIYVITDKYLLQTFNPGNGQFTTISRINCPAGQDTEDPTKPAQPFSMAVDRRGTAYILFTDNLLYRVSTATGACIGTSYRRGQVGFERFGMGFATNTSGLNEKLFVAGDQQNNGTVGLASIDPSTFTLSYVGTDPSITSAELTGTGDGRLFSFYADPNDDSTSDIGEVDTQTGLLLGSRHFDTVDQGNGWAFAFWGGDFYMFHAPNRTSTVTRWRPSDNSVATVATTAPGTVIVGAGVSTCAPQN